VLRAARPRPPPPTGGRRGRGRTLPPSSPTHSKSPNTVSVPPTGSDLRYCSLGSSPTSRSPVILPPPVTTAMYCLPPTAKLIGGPVTGAPRLNSHACLPLVWLSATRRPSCVPTKTSPPAVATVPPACSGAFVHHSHTVFWLVGSIARTTPAFSSGA